MSLKSLSRDELRDFMRENFREEVPPQPAVKPGARHICLGLLLYDAKLYGRTCISLMQAMTECAMEGWDFSVILRDGDSMVARGRSFIASQFLENPANKACTDLVFVDGDLDWEKGSFVKLIKHNVDLVGGAYPYKRDDPSYPLRWSHDGIYEENGLWAVDAVTPGFFRATRKMLERMTTRMPWLEYKEHLAGPDQRTWMLFDNLCRSNGVWDECYVFCERWRALGGTVWLDPDLNITHIGQKAFNHGTIREWVEKKKAGHLEKLEHEFPHIPPLVLGQAAEAAITGKIPEVLRELNDQYRDQEPPRAAGSDSAAHAAEHGTKQHDPDGVGGRGRRADDQEHLQLAERSSTQSVDQAAGGLSWREVRQGANGGAGENLYACGRLRSNPYAKL